ncbi:MAG: Fic family protein [Bacteroidia bacterium]
MQYNWQQPDWPHFTYELTEVLPDLLALAAKTGRMSGLWAGLSDGEKAETQTDLLAAEAVHTSEIEGSYLSRRDVVSSIQHHLGWGGNPTADQPADGIARLMVDVQHSYASPLNESQLFRWHEMLMQGNTRIRPGRWRDHDGPMQVVSGSIGREQIHFEAPPAAAVPGEMRAFIAWYNATAPGGSQPIVYPAVRAALVHLYFESIHPFEDGNGRIGRALAQRALSQDTGRPPLLSLSRTIEADRPAYYRALQQAQRSNQVSAWVVYFVRLTLQAQTQAEEQVAFILRKTRFFDRFRSCLEARHLKVLRRMSAAGPAGFEGGMNARKYAAITRVSKATATRDLQYLARLGVLVPFGSGRSTAYSLDLDAVLH